MRIEIIAVGSELLTPYYQDTNSLYLTRKLNELGLDVAFKTIVGDEPETLLIAAKTALKRADLIFAMGGLGPTDDDRTRDVFAEAMGCGLEFRRDILDGIRERFRRRKTAMPETNRKQAYVIKGARILANKNGTAPGLWLDTGSLKIAFLPGPPHELIPMFEESVLPQLEGSRRAYLIRRVFKLTGLPESKLEERIKDLYPRNADSLRVTVLAYPGQIEIHLTSFSRTDRESAEQSLNSLGKKLMSRIGDYVFSSSGEDLEEVAGRLLAARQKKLAIAESCSGGLLGHRITRVPGSSDYFLGGILAYDDRVKKELLGVPEKILVRYGAVSSQTAGAMAEGVRKKLSGDLGLAITGIAGPGGGTPRKPVGLVYIALSSDRGANVARSIYLGNREIIKFQSSQKALDMLRRHLLSSERWTEQSRR